jgi:hypothetical protein
MILLTPAFLLAALMATHRQDPKPVVLPALPPPIKITQTQSAPPAAPTPAPFRVKELSSFAVFNNTVYFKVGDMVVPMIGTSGCFTPKEILTAGDPRLHFDLSTDAPPPPPASVKQ